MKKIIKVMMVLLMVLSIVGCSKEKKTTVANQEEWDKVIEPSKYLDATITTTLISKNDDMSMKTVYATNGTVIKINDEFDDIKECYYYVLEEDSQKFAYVIDKGQGVYGKDYYDFSSKEETLSEWNKTLENMFSPNNEYIGNFADGTYDEEKKCYCFNFTLYDEYDGTIEVYVEDGVVVKEIESFTFIEDEEMVEEFIFDFNNKEEVKLPTIKNTVDNKEEWESLFDRNKYSNCAVVYNRDNMEVYSEISPTKIEQTIYFDDSDYYVDRTIDKVDETKEKVVEVDSDGETTEYDIEFDETLTCFEDNFVSLTYENDLSAMYDEIKLVDDHYEYEFAGAGTKALIKIYVCNGYIVGVDNHYEHGDGTSSDSYIYMEYFN